jgi:hypothetical protein
MPHTVTHTDTGRGRHVVFLTAAMLFLATAWISCPLAQKLRADTIELHPEMPTVSARGVSRLNTASR